MFFYRYNWAACNDGYGAFRTVCFLVLTGEGVHPDNRHGGTRFAYSDCFLCCQVLYYRRGIGNMDYTKADKPVYPDVMGKETAKGKSVKSQSDLNKEGGNVSYHDYRR